MKKILCLLLSLSLVLPIFGQDGEEVDFLDKVSEPKKTTSVAKKTPLAKTSRKKKVKKNSGKKKKQLEAKKDEFESKDGEPKKKIESEIAPDDPGQGKNSGTPDGGETSTSDRGTKEISNPEAAADLQKPYWLNEETNLTPKNLPGYDARASIPNEDNSIRQKLGEILKLGDDKKKEEEKRKAAEQKDQGALAAFFAEHKKGIILITIIIAFTLYQFRAKGSRVTRRSPVTINKVRRD
ncbi:Sec region non-globular protein [Leptospira semungkisensis]|uniref:Sec region non-globular protein n=1 Tax=Leptospira semungkisensis TaxID=2484985 RepID=A0A4R9FQE2_9LEPT|nr:SRP-less Sec system protein [Leptospira semungkisensis]TGK00908.1 Sec region non-globular protein [Leptospira semungkisensis]